MGSFTIELVYNVSGKVFPDKTLSSFNFFTRANELGGAMGDCNFRNILLIILPKYNGGEIQFFWRETFNINDN